MLGSYIRIVIAEINVGISELVQKMAFIQYSYYNKLVIGKKRTTVGVKAAVEMLIFK